MGRNRTEIGVTRRHRIGMDSGHDPGENLVIDIPEHGTIGIRAFATILVHRRDRNGWNLAVLIDVGRLREMPGVAGQDLAIGTVGDLSRTRFADDLPVGIGITYLYYAEGARPTFIDPVHCIAY